MDTGTGTMALPMTGAKVATKGLKLKMREQKQESADLELVRQAKLGEASAFRELVERYQQRAYSVAFGVLGNSEDARDVAQDSFLKAFKSLSRFRETSSFYTWLYRIVFNMAIDYRRKRYRQVELPVGRARDLDATSYGIENTSRSPLLAKIPTPDQSLERNQIGAAIKEAIESLSPEHRAVVVLREIEGLSYSEISKVIKCSKGTVMSRLFHARRKLQKKLKEMDFDISSNTQVSKPKLELEEEVLEKQVV